MRIDGICIVGKHGIRNDDTRFSVEEKPPVIVLPYGKAGDFRTTGYALTVKDGDTVEGPVYRVPAPFGGRVGWSVTRLTVCQITDTLAATLTKKQKVF